MGALCVVGPVGVHRWVGIPSLRIAWRIRIGGSGSRLGFVASLVDVAVGTDVRLRLAVGAGGFGDDRYGGGEPIGFDVLFLGATSDLASNGYSFLAIAGGWGGSLFETKALGMASIVGIGTLGIGFIGGGGPSDAERNGMVVAQCEGVDRAWRRSRI